MHDTPITSIDPFGLWNTCGHNSLLNSSFGKKAPAQFQLEPKQLAQLKKASHDMDFGPGGQDPTSAFKHRMKAPDDDPAKARAAADNFIADQLQKAIDAEQKGLHDLAMSELGKGMHTIADGSSPSHRGEQTWPGLALIHLPNAAIHAMRELWPTRGQREDVVNNLRDYYQRFQDGCTGSD